MNSKSIRALQAASLAVGGLLYLEVWLPLTKLGIPCVFHTWTGLFCPGCGITRAALALLRLDVEQAFRYNALPFLLVPLYAIYALAQRRQMRRTGRMSMAIMLVVVVSFGILRNITAFGWLAPTFPQ
ncbi:DUF2752 domain-containing protein [Paenibacillus koleovorans]|uniref:DUF2752 domain-containing protein n=1 Tax=Paenibacillus koleovorans TaxID=121608 RepID=UPI000FDB7302|nr:DUF2752 domain-containing protein [Paenibacillus koleovorans]